MEVVYGNIISQEDMERIISEELVSMEAIYCYSPC